MTQTQANRKQRSGMRRAPHPADGLYFLNLRMLRKADACHKHCRRWAAKYGETDVLVTEEMVMDHESDMAYHSSAARWALVTMFINGKITNKEFSETRRNWPSSLNVKARVRRLMDALAKRARREGRLA